MHYEHSNIFWRPWHWPDCDTLLDIEVNTQLQNLTKQGELTNTTIADNQNITG